MLGRAGREENGKVIIQTYNPDHYAIIDSKKQDYDLFFSQEIALRKMLNYPPFCDIIQISFSGENINEIKKVSEYVYNKIKSVNFENLNVYKPVPAPIDRIKNKYRWRIIVKCKLTATILDLLKFATNDEKIEKCRNTRIIVDINPNTMT